MNIPFLWDQNFTNFTILIKFVPFEGNDGEGNNQQRLKRELGLLDGASIIIGIIVGSGVCKCHFTKTGIFFVEPLSYRDNFSVMFGQGKVWWAGYVKCRYPSYYE